ncbi:MAG: response regulator [Desulfuromonadales bacterium]|nr:response regulator [Desulfuromonadales bacterium]
MAKRVLTVDDSATVRQVLSMTLSEAGYNVTEADNGANALQSFDNDCFDLVVTDLNMPRMDGIDLIRQIRSRAGTRFLPIIMLTTESQPERKQEGKKAGASGWITKPFRPEQLLAVVRMICPN